MRPLQLLLVSWVVFASSAVKFDAVAQNFDPLASETTEKVDTLKKSNPSDSKTLSPEVRVNSARARRESKKMAQEYKVSGRSQDVIYQRRGSEEAPWKRVVYRELYLDSVANSPLYYPPRPIGGEKNLFTTLFTLLNQNKIAVYEYEDLGYENFTPEGKLKFGEFLDRFGIMYTNGSGEGNERYAILPADIPSETVKSFYIKEEYYFDPITSSVNTEVTAICPVLHDNINLEGTLKIPLFWVEYKEVKNYLEMHHTMLSDMNNATMGTWDDFFRLNLYSGAIIKTQNMRGLSIDQIAKTPEEAAMEREKIESQLRGFRDRLYGANQPKSIQSAEEENSADEKETVGDKEKSDLKTARARRAEQLAETDSSSTRSRSKKSSTPKPKQSSKPKRSVRNRF